MSQPTYFLDPLPRGSSIMLCGRAQTMQSSFTGLGIGLVTAIALIYLLLVVNFQSWRDPFIILTGLTGALAGVVWALYLTVTTLSVPAMMGAIMCLGVATANSVFHLAQTQALRVYVRVPQTRARNIRPGLIAELTIPEIPGQVFKAKVVTTSQAVSATSRTLLTELELDNSDNRILPGSYAQVRFTGARAAPALTLPSNALLFRAAGLEVGVVRPDGTVEMRKVQVGRDFGKTVEVLAGVNASDRIIANPSDSLVSGASVRVADATESQAARQSRSMSLTGGQYAQATYEATR